MTDPQLPDDVQELVTKIFGLAREGGANSAATLGAYVDNGVDVNLSNQDGNTLLMLAAYAGHVEVVQALIDRGADVNRVNNRNQTPLAGAIFKKEDAVIEALLAAGADPKAGTPSAIDTAKMFGREDLVERFES
ncbi:ankyrin repeat-containing protein [Corynebacterium suranareeae]|uniref:Ankyrin repeat-containing protein n=1 Tax=Corynebacterium suranareeae TaxID=2506452 RepID=A0A169S1P3_9CORY|nr:ankyrin repeat domain-containing protein [Corynebacterium suranareeae]BAU96682.1 ankyrin repeat-containing protein [Corynebacterium suranareeae]